MNHIYILEADPTAFGGIQQFVRNLSSWLPADKVTLLAYYGKLAYRKNVGASLFKIAEGDCPGWRKFLSACGRRGYNSSSALLRNLALLLDIPRIRYNMGKLLHGDTLVLNSAFAMFCFCPVNVLRENRIILVQHTCPRMMRRRSYDFGGLFRRTKIALFRKYVETFVLLSPYEEKEFRQWLPLESKKTVVIRHAMPFPAEIPRETPRAAALLARLIPLKRIDRVIAAAKILPDVVFNIYGTGPLERKLKREASGMDNVRFKGYTDDVDAVFRDNTMLLITSDYEGYPVSGIEACVHGRGVVVLDTFPAARDLVQDRCSGLVLEDFSASALADAVRELLTHPDQYGSGALNHRMCYDLSTAQDAWRKLLLNES